VNVGGDPERDDSGLPPADFVVPDDARDLDRDVQAYYRELRAQRRRRRWASLHKPLTRDGVVLPLLAGCLILALLTGTLLTLFAAGQADRVEPPNDHPAAGSAGTPRATAKPVNRLPNVVMIPPNDQSVPLQTLTSSVVTLVPARCQCGLTLQHLVSQARQAGVTLYMVSAGEPSLAGLVTLAVDQAGEDPSLIGYTQTNVLDTKYRAHGVTAILVNSDGSVVGVERDLGPGVLLVANFRELVPGG
jgi:hypothetical protein